MAALVDTVRRMPVAGRKWIYVMRTGQIVDELVRATGRMFAGASPARNLTPA
jgi:hypothetical protein